MPIDLVLVRHGESEQNFANRKSKKNDHSLVERAEYQERHVSAHRLTAEGRRQAEDAGLWLRTHKLGKFDRRYVSTYTRAQETAQLLAVGGPDWYPLHELREREWGELDGLSWEQRALILQTAVRRQDTDSFYWIPPNGESIAQVTVRLRRMFDTWHRECKKMRVIVVCHGEIMWALRFMIEQMSIERWEELEASEAPGVKIFNCQILHYTRRDPASGMVSEHIDWMRSINARTPENSGQGWEQIDRCRMSDEDLRLAVEKFSPLFGEAEGNV
jgi:NAD+ kinase